jgi:predicted small secreted protein
MRVMATRRPAVQRRKTTMNQRLKIVLGLLLFMFAGTALTACNTLEGVGEDVQDAGEAVEDAADG